MTTIEKLRSWLDGAGDADRSALERGRAVAVVLGLPKVDFNKPNSPIGGPIMYKVHARMVGDELRCFWGDEDIGPVWPR